MFNKADYPQIFQRAILNNADVICDIITKLSNQKVISLDSLEVLFSEKKEGHSNAQKLHLLSYCFLIDRYAIAKNMIEMNEDFLQPAILSRVIKEVYMVKGYEGIDDLFKMLPYDKIMNVKEFSVSEGLIISLARGYQAYRNEMLSSPASSSTSSIHASPFSLGSSPSPGGSSSLGSSSSLLASSLKSRFSSSSTSIKNFVLGKNQRLLSLEPFLQEALKNVYHNKMEPQAFEKWFQSQLALMPQDVKEKILLPTSNQYKMK